MQALLQNRLSEEAYSFPDDFRTPVLTWAANAAPISANLWDRRVINERTVSQGAVGR